MNRHEVRSAIKQFQETSKGQFMFELKNKEIHNASKGRSKLLIKDEYLVVEDNLGKKMKYLIEDIEKIWFR